MKNQNNNTHKPYTFFAIVNRLKLIHRWSLMHNRRPESVAEHSHQTALLAHTLAIIDNEIFGQKTDANLCATLALYHDATETLTGDIPTPVKYRNAEMTAAYKKVEKAASVQLLSLLPEKLQKTYSNIITPKEDTREYKLVKYADRISALIKCVEELSGGNNDFLQAQKVTQTAIEQIEDQSVDYFLTTFMDAYSLNVDQLM